MFGLKIWLIKNHFESGSFIYVFDPLKYSVIIWFIRNIYALYSVSYRHNPNTTNPYSVYKQPNPNIYIFYSVYKKRNYSFPYKFGFGTPLITQTFCTKRPTLSLFWILLWLLCLQKVLKLTTCQIMFLIEMIIFHKLMLNVWTSSHLHQNIA